jgi:GT2 family glycosyltransferase
MERQLDASSQESPQVIPVLGFATLKRFDLADRLLASIDYPVEHLVIVDNSGTNTWQPSKPDKVNNLWVIRVPYGLGLVGAWNLIVKSTPYAPYWVLVNDDAWFAEGALEIICEDADPDGLSFPHIVPDWSCIVLGQKVVEEVGLYDERLYPLYFDDNDYERRIRNAGLSVKRIEAIVHHQNSSTLKSGYEHKNAKSYKNNQALFDSKVLNGDYSEGNWSLKIRRENSWG